MEQITAAGIVAKSPKCAGVSADGLAADSPMVRFATAATHLY
jgi:hypothetical protein